MDGARRLVVAIVAIVLISLCPTRFWIWQLVPAVWLAVLSLRVRLPVGRLVRRLAVVWALAGLMAIGLIGQPGAGLRAVSLFLKSGLCLWAVVLLAHATPAAALLHGLRRLGLPRLWTESLAFWARYYEVLAAEWQRLQLARRARTIRLDRRLRFRILTNSLGLLFIRAYERAEKVHRAMLARGYRGLD